MNYPERDSDDDLPFPDEHDDEIMEDPSAFLDELDEDDDRPPRSVRVAGQLRGLARAPWNFVTLLNLHFGFLDNSYRVREAALDALIAIAGRRPEPISVSPVALLRNVMFDFTAASGATPHVFRLLLEIDDAESRAAVKDILDHGYGSNDDFYNFVSAIADLDKRDLLEYLKAKKLSKQKTRILNRVLRERALKGEQEPPKRKSPVS